MRVALSGTAFAAGILPARSVGTRELKPDAVTSATIKNRALKAADVGSGEGLTGARGATGAPGPAGVADTSALSTRAQADARFLRGAPVTVIAQSIALANGQFNAATAACPAGYQAIAGGVDVENVLAMEILASGPVVEGARVGTLSDGLHGAPTAWSATARSHVAGSTRSFKMTVQCVRFG